MRYLPLEKLVLALVHATQKLPHYFLAYIVYVLIEYPLQSLLKKSNFMGQIAKWGTRLGSFNIRYRPRGLVKDHVLTDFVAEIFPRRDIEVICQVDIQTWRIFVDGTSSAIGTVGPHNNL